MMFFRKAKVPGGAEGEVRVGGADQSNVDPVHNDTKHIGQPPMCPVVMLLGFWRLGGGATFTFSIWVGRQRQTQCR